MKVPEHPTAGLLREKEVSVVLQIGVATLRRWRWEGKGPVYRKIGSAVRYHPDDVTAYIVAALRRSTSDRGVAYNG